MQNQEGRLKEKTIVRERVYTITITDYSDNTNKISESLGGIPLIEVIGLLQTVQVRHLQRYLNIPDSK